MRRNPILEKDKRCVSLNDLINKYHQTSLNVALYSRFVYNILLSSVATTNQVSTASFMLREISFTHTMTRCPPTPTSHLRGSYGSIYNQQIFPAVLEILPFKRVPFTLLSVYYENEKKKHSWGCVQHVCSIIRVHELSIVDLSRLK